MTLAGIRRQPLWEKASPPAPARLLWRDAMPAMVTAAHDGQAVPRPELVRVTGAVLGGRGLFRFGDRVPHVPGMLPDNVGDVLTRMGVASMIGRTWLAGLLDPGLGLIDLATPVIVAVHPNWVYGHVLLEMLPRAMVLDQICPPDWPLALPRLAVDWPARMLQLAAPRRPIVTWDPATEALRAPAFVGTGDIILPDAIRPEVGALFALLGARISAVDDDSGAGSRLIFLARDDARDRSRKVLNRAEIEAVARGAGFAVIYPERLDFAAQVRLMREAAVIAGEFGSAMHSALFARKGTVVVCLNWVNGYQSQIARAQGQVVGYVAPRGGAFRDAAKLIFGEKPKMSFAPASVRRALLQAVDCAGAGGAPV